MITIMKKYIIQLSLGVDTAGGGLSGGGLVGGGWYWLYRIWAFYSSDCAVIPIQYPYYSY